jgi:hypothetical protein
MNFKLTAPLHVAVALASISLIGPAHGGIDQPWMDMDASDGSRLLGGAILLFLAIGLLRAFPLQTIVLGAAVLVAWLASLAVGDVGGFLTAVLLLIWVLRA